MSDEWWNNPRRHCAGQFDLFDADDTPSKHLAVEVCTRDGGCPVIWPCLVASIQTDDESTVMGGTTPRMRRLVRAARLAESKGKAPAGGISSVARFDELTVEVSGWIGRGGWRAPKRTRRGWVR